MPTRFLMLTAALLASTAAHATDLIFTNGDILTMAGKTPTYVEALAVDGGKIVFSGSKQGAMALKADSTKVIDLQGHTLLPGFIDAHGHMVYAGKNLVDADLFDTPDMADLIARMKKHAEKAPEGGWIVGFGYSARKMKEGRPPTIEDLDQISTDRPVMVVDSSGHLGAGNTALFKLAGITAATKDPAGGAFARKTGGTELAGAMEETALNMVRKQRPPFAGKLAEQAITGAVERWASFGQTTAMECGVGLGDDDVDIIKEAIDRNILKIDLYLCAKDSIADQVIAEARAVGAEYAAAARDGDDPTAR